jgi:hypothetical protein
MFLVLMVESQSSRMGTIAETNMSEWHFCWHENAELRVHHLMKSSSLLYLQEKWHCLGAKEMKKMRMMQQLPCGKHRKR